MPAATTTKPRKPAARKADPFLVAKNREVRRIAAERGLIREGGEGRMVVSAPLGEELLAEAKRRTGIASDAELLETAVAVLAVGDDFGEWLLAQRGRLPEDFQTDL